MPRAPLILDRRGIGTVSSIVLMVALSLAGIVGVRALTGAVSERKRCAGEEVKAIGVGGAAPCESDRPTGNGGPPPPPQNPPEPDPEFDAAKELLDLAAELIGFNDAKKCITEGDIMACIMTALNFTPGKIFGFAFKLIKNIKRIKKVVDKFLDARRAKKARDAERCAGGKCDGNVCFAPGTPVHTLNGPVAIEQVRAGDLVWSRDDGTGEEGFRPVVRTFVTPDRPLLALTVEDGGGAHETLEVTAPHPFMVEGRGWVLAGELRPGDQLVGAGGRLVVVDRRETSRVTTVYNLEVAEFHTYFVGAGAAWVHNQCKDDPKKPKKEEPKRGTKKTNDKCKGDNECAVGHCHTKRNGDQVCVNCDKDEIKGFLELKDKFCKSASNPRSCTGADLLDGPVSELETRISNGNLCVQGRSGESKRCFGGGDKTHLDEVSEAERARELCRCIADVMKLPGLDPRDVRAGRRTCMDRHSR